MDDKPRLYATVAIWLTYALIMAGLIFATLIATGADAEGADISLGGAFLIFIVFLILTLAVTESTQAIWKAERKQPQSTFAKVKRSGRDRMERLIEKLDNDDIYDLETLLLAREEEHTKYPPASR